MCFSTYSFFFVCVWVCACCWLLKHFFISNPRMRMLCGFFIFIWVNILIVIKKFWVLQFSKIFVQIESYFKQQLQKSNVNVCMLNCFVVLTWLLEGQMPFPLKAWTANSTVDSLLQKRTVESYDGISDPN